MIKMNHTPGPWTIHKCNCGHDKCNDYFISITKSDGRVTKNDAYLIAAAPEMLIEIERYLTIAKREGWHATVAGLEKLINKVTGVQAKPVRID